MIFLIWFVSLIISVAPILGWRDHEFYKRIEHKQCLLSQDVTYQIFATCASFYLPLLFILLLYWRIFKVSQMAGLLLLLSLVFIHFKILFHFILFFRNLPLLQNTLSFFSTESKFKTQIEKKD